MRVTHKIDTVKSSNWERVGFVNGHLPETRGQVDGREDRGVSSSNVADALVDFFHCVLVSVGLGVEPPKVLNDPEALS